MQDFRSLKVWDKGHELTLQIYRVTSSFPREEQFGLVSQMRRASPSIPTNIAEGCGRGGEIEFARFLSIAAGSACEVEYHLLLARDLKFITSNDYDQIVSLVIEIKKMLTSLIHKLRTSAKSLKTDN